MIMYFVSDLFVCVIEKIFGYKIIRAFLLIDKTGNATEYTLDINYRRTRHQSPGFRIR